MINTINVLNCKDILYLFVYLIFFNCEYFKSFHLSILYSLFLKKVNTWKILKTDNIIDIR